MMNYFQLNNLKSSVRNADNGYNYHVYPSTTSCEKYDTYGRSVDENISYDFHDCIDSPLDLSRKKIVDNAGVAHVIKSENVLELAEPHLNKENMDNFNEDTHYPVDLSKAPIGKDYSTTSKISDKENDSPEPDYRRRRFHCNHCPYCTNHKNDLRKHMFGAHCKTEKVVCPKCGKPSKHRYSLAVHLSYCGKEPRFHCPYCPYKSRKRGHLQRHVIKHVNGSTAEAMSKAQATHHPMSIITPFCNQDDYAVPSLSNIEVKPTFNVKECPSCGKKFKYWGHMQRHYRSCSGNYIQCELCPYKAKDSSMLEIHVSSAHLITAYSDEASVTI